MRLSEQEISVLKSTLRARSTEAELYLFGSRVDDTKRGGDIDLLVVANDMTPRDLRHIRIEFFKHFGEQKLDILLDNGTFKDPFTHLIRQKAVLL